MQTLVQRRDMITKHQFALHLIRDSTDVPNYLPQSEHPQAGWRADEMKDATGGADAAHAAEGLQHALNTAATRHGQLKAKAKSKASVTAILTAEPAPLASDAAFQCAASSLVPSMRAYFFSRCLISQSWNPAESKRNESRMFAYSALGRRHHPVLVATTQPLLIAPLQCYSSCVQDNARHADSATAPLHHCCPRWGKPGVAKDLRSHRSCPHVLVPML